jgi:insertion element IS1 protein InsB
VNKPRREQLNPDALAMVIHRVAAAESDEMWSSGGKKKEPRWLWHVIDHQTGKGLAYVFGRRQEAV